MYRCGWCGRVIPNASFCSHICAADHAEMMSKPFIVTASYLQAARYLGRDARTVRQYEGMLFAIDRSLRVSQVKPVTCRSCGNSVPTAEGRQGYCKPCRSKGEGRKAQAKAISERYRGEGNPNFVNGESKTNFRHVKDGKQWRRAVLKRDGVCRICDGTENLTAHHVLPAALFPEEALSVGNGITLCGPHHTELHRLRLDVLLAPTLFAFVSDVQELHTILAVQPEFLSIPRQIDTPYRKRDLVRVVPRNYQRLILRLHPEFARQVLGL